MTQVFLVDALRTPVGRHGGALSEMRPDDLSALVIRAILRRHPWLDPAELADVVWGAANQAGEDNRNVARMALLLAGLPDEVPGFTVNRLCASSLSAVGVAAGALMMGQGEVALAGGVESMTRAPLVMAKGGRPYQRGDRTAYDTTLGWRFPNEALARRFPLESMAETAENVAERFQVGRARQDAFALASQQKWKAAHEAGAFQEEILPVDVPGRRGSTRVEVDEHPRPESTLDGLSRLPPIVRADGTVTAGNASGINDGAAGLLLATQAAVERHGLSPLARLVGVAQVGVDPRVMGIGPIPATEKLLRRLEWRIGDVDLMEINEAFASQSLACQDVLGVDPERVNVHGGAIAIGHPLGCSGARILTTLLYAMRRRGAHRGIATMCVGVGQGVAVAVER